MTEGVRIERHGAVLLLRFDRLPKKNAITGEMYQALAQALENANGDDGIGVCVLLGSPGMFTAGNDIGDFLNLSGRPGGSEPVLRFVRALASCDRPLLAGVDGPAIGIGTTLLLHCDYVLASPRSVFRTPFTALGLVPEAASSLLASRIMGHPRAFELLVMGKDFDAEAARQAGLVNAVVEPDALEAGILNAARDLAARPREAVLAARRLLKGDPAEVSERIGLEARIFAERLRSPEAQAAFAGFLGKGTS